MPTWSPSPPELVALFESVMPGPPAVARKMFGYPAGFVNDHMFMGLHEHRFVLRLGDEDREALLAVEGAETFEPMEGRPMREYVVVPPAVLDDMEALEAWVERALAHAAALPPKPARKPSPKAKTPPAPKAPGAKGPAPGAATPTRGAPVRRMSPRRSPGRQGPSRGR